MQTAKAKRPGSDAARPEGVGVLAHRSRPNLEAPTLTNAAASSKSSLALSGIVQSDAVVGPSEENGRRISSTERGLRLDGSQGIWRAAQTTELSNAGDGSAASSSFATGGYGVRFENRVAGWILAKLLMRQSLLDVPGTIVNAGFQRSLHGAFLDDAVLTTDAGIEIQVSIKAGVTVAERDADFRDSIMLAWTAQSQGRWAGMVAPPDAPGIRAFRRLVFLARETMWSPTL